MISPLRDVIGHTTIQNRAYEKILPFLGFIIGFLWALPREQLLTT